MVIARNDDCCDNHWSCMQVLVIVKVVLASGDS